MAVTSKLQKLIYQNVNQIKTLDVQLADENTELYKRSWQEIYEMLKKETGK